MLFILYLISIFVINVSGSTTVYYEYQGETRTVDVNPTDTINDLKRAADLNDDVAIQFQGQIIRDGDALLSDIGIGAEATVHIVPDSRSKLMKEMKAEPRGGRMSKTGVLWINI